MSAFLVRSANVQGDNNLYLDMVASKISLDGIVKEYVYYRLSYERYDADNHVTVREGEQYYPLTAFVAATEAFAHRVESEHPEQGYGDDWTLESIARDHAGNGNPGFHHQSEPQATEMPHYTRPPGYHPPPRGDEPKSRTDWTAKLRGRYNRF